MNNIATIRAKLGLTQTALGKKLGISRAGMSYIEKHHLTAKTAAKIAKVLGVSTIEVLGKDIFKVLPKTQEEKELVLCVLKDLNN